MSHNMDKNLIVKAGKTALAHIRENGLSPEDVGAVFGASGAAKWLGIYGLDRAIFSRWLKGISHPVAVVGTSVGAWKLAAAAQADCARAFDRLKDAYISQTYRGRVSPAKVTRESFKILNRFIPQENIPQILSHPTIKLGFLSVRCRNLMAMKADVPLGAGLACAGMLNLAARRTQRLFFDRTLFHVSGFHVSGFNVSGLHVSSCHGTGTDDAGAGQAAINFGRLDGGRVVLTGDNFYRALLSSGSIPVIMEGIQDIPGAGPGVYRDGGILDYHPVFPLDQGAETPQGPDRLILYPHFYPHIIPGWFDKNLAGRRANGSMVDRVVLVCPSPEFVAGLPHGRIPDRKDFIRFRGRDRERYMAWHLAARKSLELGEAFVDAVDSGRIRGLIAPL